MRYPDGGVYRGSWHAGIRKGYGEYTDSLGRTYSGYWRGDSLRRGRLRAKEGTYEGLFNRRMEEHGEGEFTANDGGYYVGKWKDGRRDGFGFSVAPHEVVKCGVWAKEDGSGANKCCTIRNGYTASTFPNTSMCTSGGGTWYRLEEPAHYTFGAYGRPECVGSGGLSGLFRVHQIHGGADGVQSLLYAGCACRTPVWISGRSLSSFHPSGDEPGRLFPEEVPLAKGDLPPMLDVELSDRRIAAMGGRDVLFREMLVWLKEVGRRAAPHLLYM